MNGRKKVGLALVVCLLVVGFGYWRYSHVTCIEKARVYVNGSLDDARSASELKTLFDLSYKICMGKKGF